MQNPFTPPRGRAARGGVEPGKYLIYVLPSRRRALAAQGAATCCLLLLSRLHCARGVTYKKRRRDRVAGHAARYGAVPMRQLF
ncbi:hypothetical protein EVAR_46004_1 [Eumeta japonica]|uniref:Uncharacterized protein n=1 Tax=Eumeta variegata TaxID=151549 RepID=A0A4C1X763_EUMVA|nr:hypothetical protein EVAR_46004_1 [Eumeta japonica]